MGHLVKQDQLLERLYDEAFLDMGTDYERLLETGPISILSKDEEYVENPHYLVMEVINDSNYLWWAAYYFLGIKLMPFQLAILEQLWNYTFPMLIASRGAGKTFLLAVYAVLRALLCPGSKVVIVGAAFRQAKIMFEYMETFWRQSPMLRSVVGTGKHEGPKRDIDRCNFYIGDSIITAIPLGDGQKIRGLRATHTLVDEFASVSKEIFEVVVGGFGIVAGDPHAKVNAAMYEDLLKELGVWMPEMAAVEELGVKGNQTVISGTAYYAFNHFYDYWKKHKAIIDSRGDERKLSEIFGGDIPVGFDWTKWTLIRVPYTALPRHYLDMDQVSRSQVQLSKSIFNMEFGAIFMEDSDGFFRRSLIESCVTKNPIIVKGQPIQFHAQLKGDPNCQYVFGIDPASERDNLAVVILEVHPDHTRIVYTWTINRVRQKEMLKRVKVDETNFYNYCARKIRDLMYLFPTEHIGIDSQGGGIQLLEILSDPTKAQEGEHVLLPYIRRYEDDPYFWEEMDKPTDEQQGKHILHMVQFANYEFTRQANHGLRQDMEDKILLFPFFDHVEVEMSIIKDKEQNREWDTLEDAVVEIEELKDELATIEHSQTSIEGREKWDTPKVKQAGQKVGRLRKDRYSALLIANMLARLMKKKVPKPIYNPTGGYVGKDFKNVPGGAMYISGNPEKARKLGNYGMGVHKRN